MQHQLQIIPARNLISNIGFGTASAHSDDLNRLPKATRQLFGMKTYELEFPLRHPKCMIPDLKYEKKHRRITGYGHPLVVRWRKLERFFLILRSGDFKYLKTKLKKLINPKARKET